MFQKSSRSMLSREDLRELAHFRYSLRRFLRFSENAARACGITPQQHQLMLGVAGFTDTGYATIGVIAEFLQEKHHSVVGLVDRAVQSGLVEREVDLSDRRVVRIILTPQGEQLLKRLSLAHRDEVRRLRRDFLRTGLKLSRAVQERKRGARHGESGAVAKKGSG